jgi:hypothetical protein
MRNLINDKETTMKLSEVKTAENLKVLVCGSPGSGKTCFAASFPYPLLFLDFDNKINSAAAWFADDKTRLENIDVRQLGKRLDGADPIVEMNKIIAEELIPQQKSGEMKYKTLVVDSMTTFSAAVLAHIVKTNPGIKRVPSSQGVQACMQDFGILKREFARLIPGLLSLPMNVIMTAHIKIDKSDLTGEIIRSPIMDGSFSQELPIYFEEVYRVFNKEGKPYAQTKSDSYYDFCRSQIPGLPNPVELSYQNLTKKWK